jgi:hypothetical protein
MEVHMVTKKGMRKDKRDMQARPDTIIIIPRSIVLSPAPAVMYCPELIILPGS